MDGIVRNSEGNVRKFLRKFHYRRACDLQIVKQAIKMDKHNLLIAGQWRWYIHAQ